MTETVQQYERRKRAAAARNRAQALAGQETAPMPPVRNPLEKAACTHDLKRFCERYFAKTFYLPWSRNQLVMIDAIGSTIVAGRLLAIGGPRGEGKTSIAKAGALWALLYGHISFVQIITSTHTRAQKAIGDIKTWLETNDLLFADFPEVCHFVRCLEGVHNRCAGQRYLGQRTRITWRRDEIIFPIIPGSPCSEAILRITSITGNIRGETHARADGTQVRPQLVLLDDPQTEKTAKSTGQTDDREDIIQGAVMGLAGQDKSLAALMLTTVIREDDLADRYLDAKRHPEWRGQRLPTIFSFPKNMKLWAEYGEIYARCIQEDEPITPATKFYAARRKVMDKGADISWPEAYKPEEISGIQSAMNAYYRLGPKAFHAERQNRPLRDEAKKPTVDPKALSSKLNRVPRGTVPVESEHLTAYIDVHAEVLFWLVAAFDRNIGGALVDYGTYPRQRQHWFTLRRARHTLSRASRGMSLEANIHAGLTALAEELLDREWPMAGGGVRRISRCLIDANWGQTTDLIYQFCRESKHAALLYPGHGIGIGAKSKPWSQYERRKGEQLGEHWRISPSPGRAIRHVVIDTYYWKSVLAQRLNLPQGDRGSIALFGAQARVHELLCRHLSSERAEMVEARGRRVEEWDLPDKQRDNHWWDCLVGCAVGASIQGARASGQPAIRPARRMTFADFNRTRSGSTPTGRGT